LGYLLKETKIFYDAFYDTYEYDLLQKNLWLRRRTDMDESFENWKLTQGPVTVFEGVKSDLILTNVLEIKESLEQKNLLVLDLEDETPTGQAPHCFALFKTTRCTYSRKDSPDIHLDSIQLGKKTFYWIGTIYDETITKIPKDVETIIIEGCPVMSKVIKLLHFQNHPALQHITVEKLPYLNSTVNYDPQDL